MSGGDAALKPNSITLASSELAPNMFEAGSCQIPLHYSWFGAISELASNMFGASSEIASVMEFGFKMVIVQSTSREKRLSCRRGTARRSASFENFVNLILRLCIRLPLALYDSSL